MHKSDDLHEKVLQFKRYLAQPERQRLVKGAERDGKGWARLLANDIRALKGVEDHAVVAKKLAKSGEAEALIQVVASGLLSGWALRIYRMALAWLSR